MFAGMECNGNGDVEGLDTVAALLCVQCKDSFSSAWDLMVHVQAAHMLNIYELGVPSGRVQRRSHSSSEEDQLQPQQQTSKESSQSPPPIATPPTPTAAVCPVPLHNAKDERVSYNVSIEVLQIYTCTEHDIENYCAQGKCMK